MLAEFVFALGLILSSIDHIMDSLNLSFIKPKLTTHQNTENTLHTNCFVCDPIGPFNVGNELTYNSKSIKFSSKNFIANQIK